MRLGRAKFLGAGVAGFALLLLLLYYFIALRVFDFHVVKLAGIESAGQYFYPPTDIAVAGSDAQPVWVLARHDDQLQIYPKGGSSFITTYAWSDGDTLAFTFDNVLLTQNGVAVCLILDDTGFASEAWEWIRKATPRQIRGLRFLVFGPGADAEVSSPERPYAFSPEHLLLVKKIARYNPHVGLMVHRTGLKDVAALLDPRVLFLVVGEPLTPEEGRVLGSFKKVRTLWLSFEASYDAQSLSFVQGLTGLRRLSIISSDTIAALPRCPKSLRSLLITNASLPDLSFLKEVPQLNELSLENCNGGPLEPLKELKGLFLLDLSGYGGAKDLSALDGLPRLKTVGLPAGMPSDSYAPFMQNHRFLRGLTVAGADASFDPGLLKHTPFLEDLVFLNIPPVDLTPLRGLKRLRYLALYETVFSDENDAVQALQKELSHCRIVAARPMCLGSGWVFAFVLLLALFRAGHGFLKNQRACRQKIRNDS